MINSEKEKSLEDKTTQSEKPDNKETDEQLLYRESIENKKMFIILCLATAYCFVTAIVCGYFKFNKEAFTG